MPILLLAFGITVLVIGLKKARAQGMASEKDLAYQAAQRELRREAQYEQDTAEFRE